MKNEISRPSHRQIMVACLIAALTFAGAWPQLGASHLAQNGLIIGAALAASVGLIEWERRGGPRYAFGGWVLLVLFAWHAFVGLMMRL